MEDDRSESRDSCYFPGCRKDANCNCKICLDSINATLDLMPCTQKSSLTNLSTSKPIRRSPVTFNPSIMSTPKSKITLVSEESLDLKSTARVSKNKEFKITKKKDWGFRVYVVKLNLFLGLIFVSELGFPWMISGILKTDMSADLVNKLGEKSRSVKDLNGKLGFLQRELENFVDGKVSNCSYDNSMWKINQDGLLLHSRCTLYKSMTEEVSIWGWPLQTAGLLTTGLSSSSFTVLSGRITEWSDRKMGYITRNADTFWSLDKWNASVVQLDKNTWILEYRRSMILENTRLFSAALEFFKLRISKSVQRLKMRFWAFSVFENQNRYSYKRGSGSKIPT